MAPQSKKSAEQIEAELAAEREATAEAEGMNDAQLAQRLDVLRHRVQHFGAVRREAYLLEAARRLRSGRKIEGGDAPHAHL